MAFRSAENIEIEQPKFRVVKNVDLDPAEEVRKRALRESLEEIAQEMGVVPSLVMGVGRGLEKIGRGVGLLGEETKIEKLAAESLKKERPISTMVGEVVGEAIPFAAAPGANLALPARTAVATGLGALEGAIIRRGEGAKETEQLKAAGVGGTIAGLTEYLLPVVGRIGSKIVRKVTGRAAKSDLITPGGMPTAELDDALSKAGLTFDDVTDAAKDIIDKQAKGTPAEQAERISRFQSLGVPATKGNITKEVRQQAKEARLLENTSEEVSSKLRTVRLEQSRKLTDNLEMMVDESGVPENIGDKLKEALSGKKNLFEKEKKTGFTKEAAEAAQEKGFLPFPTEAIYDAIPDARTIREIRTFEPQKVDALFDLLAEFGVDQSDEALERLSKKKIEPIPLNLNTFDTFRKSLNRIMDVVSGQPNHMAVLAGPIKEALDNEADNLVDIMEKAGADDRILLPLKEARKVVRQLKIEFSPQSITGKLIGVKRDGFTPIIEASQVFNQVVGTNKPKEFLKRTINSLRGAGKDGTDAIGDLQAATIVDLINSAFKAETRTIRGEKVFSGATFNKRLNQIGEEKLKLIFGTRPEMLKKLKNIAATARDIQADSIAEPKGSASVLLDVLGKTGLFTLLGKIPGANLLSEGFIRLTEGNASRIGINAALKARPDVQRPVKLIEMVAPSLLVSLGIAGTEESEKE